MTDSDNFSLYIGDDDRIEAAIEKPYRDEAELQRTVENLPELLDVATPDRLVLLASEVGIPGELYGSDIWALDSLFVDHERVLTLAEVKLERNAEIRRKVMGQVIDYAAHAALHWTPEFLRGLIQGVDDGVLEADDDFVHDVHTNLRAGRIRLVVVTDRMPAGLQHMIEFLDDQTTEMEITGIAIPRFEIDGRTFYAPRATRRAPSRSARSSTAVVPIDEQANSLPDIEDLISRIGTTLDARIRDTAKSRNWTLPNGVRVQVTPEWGKMFFDVGTIPDSEREEFRKRLAAIAGPTHELKEWYPSIPADRALQRWGDIDGLLKWLASIVRTG